MLTQQISAGAVTLPDVILFKFILTVFIFKKTNSYTIILKLHKHIKMANQAQFVKIVHLNHSVALVAL